MYIKCNIGAQHLCPILGIATPTRCDTQCADNTTIATPYTSIVILPNRTPGILRRLLNLDAARCRFGQDRGTCKRRCARCQQPAAPLKRLTSQERSTPSAALRAHSGCFPHSPCTSHRRRLKDLLLVMLQAEEKGLMVSYQRHPKKRADLVLFSKALQIDGPMKAT